MMLFESPGWGWSESLPEVEFGQTLVKGAGRLIALNKQQRRDQAFFNREGLRFGGIIGYHYSFLNNRTDAELLEQKYNVYLSLSHQVNLKMLLNNRLDVVMTHDQYLVQLQDEPWFDQLLLQSEPYMEYDLRSVINPRKGFTLSEWQAVLQPRIDDGSFVALLARYHLPWPPRPLEL
ncbi:hypothetical protein CWI71_01615 [Pseudidiomarina insulisalsae]|uniref:Solute-binding protein family 3/N-terminal domain-containing protein n=2 Tax=Pseudidiomarina insulisalsae TaxID=575789 RepID=A0A432YPG6_9GAMM|nr:hypothetical protein CWI71_01615 [Pseudidiomarina insulisalsae]